MNRKTLIIGGVLTLGFGALLCLFHDFVFDDAFIIYRYSRHLAQGHGMVWNVGQDPVEGFTSLLWVVLNAGAVLCGADPVIFSKVLSVLASLAVIWILALNAKGRPMSLSLVFVGAIGLSPPFAFLAMLGMETAATALVLLAAALAAVRIAGEGPAKTAMLLWYGAALLGFAARPDTAAYNSGVFIGLAAVFIGRKDYAGLRSFLIAGIPALFVFIIYMIWRTGYFGYPLPNTYYVKMAGKGGIIKIEGVRYLLSFARQVLFPYVLLCAYLFHKHRDKQKLAEAFPVFLGAALFCLYLFFINPIQGFLWRFIFPAFPALVLGFIHCFPGVNIERSVLRKQWAGALLVLFFAFWTLRLVPLALFEKDARRSDDRILSGKMLSGLSGVMFVSESGALPYYSAWRSCDLLGLTSEEISHRGLSYEFMQRLNPDLIMLHEVSGIYRPDSEAEMLVNRYLIENGFMAVAAINKSGDQFHFYFMRATSPLFREAARRLLEIDGVLYGDLEELMFERRIPVFGSPRPPG